jgi:23S rRNA (cytosine1962-C5)-methyltransferase
VKASSGASATMPSATRMRTHARVALRKNLARAISAGHPWIFRDALKPGPALADGAVVLLTTGEGRPLGRGFWTASTPIAVRMLTTDAGDDLPTLLGSRLTAALQRRLDVIDIERTDAFRWVHGEADLLPGLHLDLYGPYGAVRFDGPGARAFYEGLTSVIGAAGARVGLHSLIERVPRRRDGKGECQGQDGGAALLGRIPAGEIEVRENGLRFGVDLAHGQKGGLFLDQRENRERVRGLARGLRVLNLFGYTGGFSVYAAAGGATSTVTVDSAAGAIDSARRNFERNDLSVAAAGFVVADVFAFLSDAAKNGRQWDLVISDPPSFAPNRRALPEALVAYRRLHRMCAGVVAPGGILCAASCSSHVDQNAFVDSVVTGCAEAGRVFHARAHHGAGVDHPVLAVFPEGRYLKFSIGAVG